MHVACICMWIICMHACIAILYYSSMHAGIIISIVIIYKLCVCLPIHICISIINYNSIILIQAI